MRSASCRRRSKFRSDELPDQSPMTPSERVSRIHPSAAGENRRFLPSRGRRGSRSRTVTPNTETDHVTAPSRPRLLQGPYGRDRDHVVDALADYPADTSEFDKPIPIRLGQDIDHPSLSGMRAEILHTLDDRFTGALSGRWTLGTQECTEAFEVTECRRGENHSWPSGVGGSFSVPQLASHLSTFAVVARRAVAWESSHAFNVSCRRDSRLSSRSTSCTMASRMIQGRAAIGLRKMLDPAFQRVVELD